MKKYFVILFLSSFTSLCAFAQRYNNKVTIQRVKVYLQKMEKSGFYGSVLVGLDGKKVFSEGYGYRDEAKNLKNNPFTIFNISSVTKQFTAAAILKLEMQGRLSTSDKIGKFFTNVPADKVNITIHDLLRHQSGLVSTIGQDYDKIDKQIFIDKVFATKLLFKPCERFSYSNIGYSILALIIEKVSGKTYEDYVCQNLFKPAGMEQTGTSKPLFNPDNVAIGYYSDGRVWGKPTDKGYDKDDSYWNITGNGSILSNVEDMYKWCRALQSNQILSPGEKYKLFHPVLRPNEDGDNYYGYGWDVHKTERGTIRVWHNGVNNIMYADLKQFINDHVVIITLSNKSNRRNFDAKISDDIEKIIFDKNFEPVIPVAESKQNIAFTENMISTILNLGIEAAKINYNQRGKHVDIVSYLINNKGYDMIHENNLEQAIALFQFNVFAFPKSADAYDSLAEGYMDKGDKALAIKYYEKSLALNPNNFNAVDMLKKLK